MNKDSSWIDEILERFFDKASNEWELVFDMKQSSDEAKAAIQAELVRIIKELFPEYDNITNPGYTFMISKAELDERAGITPQSGREEVFEQD